MAKALLTLFILTLGSISLTACNTVEGIGEDIENAGRKISDSVD